MRRLLVPIVLAAAGGCSPSGDKASENGKDLWFGPIHVCRDTVESTKAIFDPSGVPGVIISFRPKMKRKLILETTKRVNTEMPVTLDGEVVASPLVLEPLVGTELQLAGASPEEIMQIQRAARSPCRRGSRPNKKTASRQARGGPVQGGNVPP